MSVKAQPGGQTLIAGTLNTVTATTTLAFDVTVQDSGDFQEVHIPVTLTIDRRSRRQADREDADDPADQPGRARR